MSEVVRLADRIRLEFGETALYGTLDFDPTDHVLTLTDSLSGEIEVLSINLEVHGYLAGLGEVLVKDWSEHRGLAAALVNAEVAQIVEPIHVGPFGSCAWRIALTTP